MNNYNTFKIEHCVETNIGLKRKRNEDSFIIAEPNDKNDIGLFGYLFAIADGMGGHPCGDVASGLSVEILETAYYSKSTYWEKILFSISPKFLKNRLKWSFDIVQKTLWEYEIEHPQCSGLGTTLSALVLLKRNGIIAHVGDSRIYRIRDTHMSQLTSDDTLIQELIKTERFNNNKSKLKSYKHVLTQAIGAGGYRDIHTLIIDIKSHDKFLLSTDGLHDLVTDHEIKGILMRHELCKACEELVNLALSRGGEDNITVIVLEIE